jgi:hypothetical protein
MQAGDVRDEAVVDLPPPAPTPIPKPIAIEPPASAPAVDEAAQPRKWQPPAPTVPPVVTERKGGWWSKR